MEYSCEQGYCTDPVTWKCTACNKILCKRHSRIENHDCKSCYYCGKKSTGYCDLCGEQSCSKGGCTKHKNACASKKNTTGCKMCVNGRIPINSFGDSVHCYYCR